MAQVARDTVNGWVSWGAWNVGLLSFDHSLFDGADVFGVSPLDTSFGGLYDNVSALMQRITIARGRNDNLTTMLAGEATVDLRDPDGIFNPDNAGALVNLCTNPSFEVDASVWTNGTAAVTRDVLVALFGAASGKFVSPGVTNNEYIFFPIASLTNGVTYIGSAYIKGPVGAAVYIHLSSNVPGVITQQICDGTWQRVSSINTPTATGAANLYIATRNSGAAQAITVNIDGVQIEVGAAPSTYCDGDQKGCRWAGAAGLSQSIRGGPLYGQLEDRLHPIKIVSTFAGIAYPRFYGWVDQFSWQPSGRRGITQLHCVDLFYWLRRANPVIASTGVTTTGAAIGLVLDAIGATDVGMRDLDVGDTIPDFSANGSVSGLDLIANLLAAERGAFFVAGTGKATYRSRLSRLTKTSSATITDHMNGMAPGVDFNQSQTRVTVMRTQSGHTAVVTADATTLSKIGYVDAPQISTPYLTSDAQADQLAAWILSQVKTPRPPMYSFELDNRETALLTQILQRELIDRITVAAARGGTVGDYHIDSLTETIDFSAGTGKHSAAWLLSRASTAAPLVFDTSTFDGPGVFVY